MSDSLVVPIAIAVQFGGLLFGAGVGWNALSNIKERQKEDREKSEKDIKEAKEKSEKDIKEAKEKADRELKETKDRSERELEKLRLEVKGDVNTLRGEVTKTMSEVRAEAQAGREAIRLEMSTMIQTTSEVRAERINQAFTDFEKMAESISDFREENRNNHGTLSNALRDMHWRIHVLEEDAKTHGWKKTSERAMQAVDPDRQRGSYPGDPPPPYGGRPDVRGGFDPKAPR